MSISSRQRTWNALSPERALTAPAIAAIAKLDPKTVRECLVSLVRDGKIPAPVRNKRGTFWRKEAGSLLNPLSEAQLLKQQQMAMDDLERAMPWTDCDREAYRTAAYFGRV